MDEKQRKHVEDVIFIIDRIFEPCRYADVEIAVLIFGAENIIDVNPEFPKRKYQSKNHYSGWGYEPIPHYTRNTDDALTLIGGRNFTLSQPYILPFPGKPYQMVVEQEIGYGALPALAICHAALKLWKKQNAV